MARARRTVVDPAGTSQTLGEMYQLIDTRYGLAVCPSCLEKVAVLVDGECRSCNPEEAS